MHIILCATPQRISDYINRPVCPPKLRLGRRLLKAIGRHLFGARPNPDAKFEGATSLHLAAMRGDAGIVRMLLLLGGDAAATTKSGMDVLAFSKHHGPFLQVKFPNFPPIK